VIFGLLCLGIVFIAGWYFQSSLVELRTQLIEDIAQQKLKIEVQAEIIQQLNKKLDLLQLQIIQHQLTVS